MPLFFTFNLFSFFELYVSVCCGEMASGDSSVKKTSFKDLYNRAVDLHVKQGCSFEIAWRVVSREFDEEFKQAYRCSSKSSQKSSSPGDQEEDSSFSGQLERDAMPYFVGVFSCRRRFWGTTSPSQSTPSGNLSLSNRPPEVIVVAVDTPVLFEKRRKMIYSGRNRANSGLHSGATDWSKKVKTG